jgi:hypothetical protein
MKKNKPSDGKGRITTTQRHTTTLRVPMRPITLDKSGLVDLCKLVEKAAPDSSSASIYGSIPFKIEGKSEVIKVNSAQALENMRLPRDLRSIYLHAQSYQYNKEIEVHIWDIDSTSASFSEIEVSGQDADWVSARARELEDFISDHRNFYWVFRNIGFVIFQAIALTALMVYLLRDNILGVILAFAVGYAYIFIIRKIYPIVVLETGRPSALKMVRQSLAVLIPAIFVSLIVTLISKLIPIG